MHLLNVNTYQLEGFFDSARPSYAILSHTWGEDETSYQDLQAGRKRGLGWTKIEACCRQASTDGYDYVWIDTCCIDKTSSAELSEAINSMYQWYRKSEICYVYMSDVTRDGSHWEQDSAFRRSRWFSRGWTLQEFLAPKQIRFVDQSWIKCFELTRTRYRPLDEPERMVKVLSEITGISYDIVKTGDFEHITIAQRLSWASSRTTTRIEDMAYSLLGIIGINMPLLYGEGQAAFRRLQEEALKTKLDQSYLCWGFNMSWDQMSGRDMHLAPSPEFFRNCSRVHPCGGSISPIFSAGMLLQSVTNLGLEIEVPLVEIDEIHGTVLALLPYHPDGGEHHCTAVALVRISGDSIFRRLNGVVPFRVLADMIHKARKTKICILKQQALIAPSDTQRVVPKSFWKPRVWTRGSIWVSIKEIVSSGYRLTGYYPDQAIPFDIDGRRGLTFPTKIDHFFLEFTSGPSRIGVSFHRVWHSRSRWRMRLFRICIGSTLPVAFSVKAPQNLMMGGTGWFKHQAVLEESCNNSSCTDSGHLHLVFEIKRYNDMHISLKAIRGDVEI